jgi:hypothetical protein
LLPKRLAPAPRQKKEFEAVRDGQAKTVSFQNTQIEVFRSSQKKIYAYQHLIELFTITAQSSGPESIGPERRFLGLSSRGPVLSPSRITLENNGKIRPQPDRENAFAGASGGDEGIRTLETVSRLLP